jgi:predicted DNA-binding ribbon-helix-helix protein
LLSAALEGLVSPVVNPPDPDLEDLVKVPARLPDAWWKELDEESEATRCNITYLVIQLVRHSLRLPEPPPLPEGPELHGGSQSSVRLRQWMLDQLDAEAAQRGYSRNKLFQAHLRRGLQAHYADRETKAAAAKAAQQMSKAKR